ncbi:MAG: efflux RND transporter permease subunit [Planctomycetes bacterium]|nr:efflux RND transporter permease subunit [Planctomycetota bacterium]
MSELWTTDHARSRHPVLAFFAGRPITVTVLLTATAVIGLIALNLLPVELFPAGLQSKSLSVEVPYSKAGNTISPMTVERDLTLVVEAELSTIPGIKELWATSNRTGADFNIEFDGDRNMDEAYAEVTAAIERARLKLPADTGRIRVWRRGGGSSGNWPVAFINFSWEDGTVDPHLKLERVVQPFLENVEGVASVTFLGTKQKFIAVDFDPEKTRSYGVNLAELLGRLRGDNFREPAGKITAGSTAGGGKDIYIVADSRFASIAEIEELPVRPGLALWQITRHLELPDGAGHRGVYETYGVNSYVRTNGRWAATAQVFQNGDANTVTVGNRVNAALAELQNRPELAGFSMRTAWNQGDAIQESISNLMGTLYWGGLLAFVVLLLFLKSWRLSLVIALAIPLCMTLTLAVMYFANQTINLLALMGFTLAGGMLLDNAIVVAENVYRRSSMGETPLAAAIRGAGEVGLALVLATSTTVIVFITVIFLSEEPFIGFVMGKIGLPVCVSLGFSVLLALAVVPMTMNTAGLLKPGHTSRGRRWFVQVRARLQQRRQRGGFAAITALAGLAIWEVAALAIGRNSEGLPGTPLVDGIARAYDLTTAGLMRLRYLVVPVALGLTLWGVMELPGRLERTDQNQGNRDRIQMSVRFPRNSDIAVAKRALMLTEVKPGSQAERAKLRPGDFILAYNTRKLASLDDLRALERSLAPGVKVPVEVARGSSSDTLEFTTGELGIEAVMEDTQPLRDAIWARYVFDVEEILLGVDGADTKREQAVSQLGLSEEEALRRYGRTKEEARQYFGLEMLTASFSERRAMFWLYIDKTRVDQAGEFFKRVQAAMPQRAGMDVSGEFQGGSSSTSEVTIRISGPDTQRLLQLADDIVVRLGGVEGLEGVRVDTAEGMDEVTVAIERQRAAAMGVAPSTLSQVLGFQLTGTTLRDFSQGDNLLPLRVRFAPPADSAGNARDPDLQDVSETRIATGAGGSVAAKAITRTTGLANSGLGEIRRRNRQTSLRVVGTTSTEDLDRIRRQVDSAMEGVQLPPGYNRELAGRFSDFGARFDDLFKTLIWSGVLVFLVMCFLFESFMKPVCILMVSIPGALFGGYGALWLFNTPFDVITGLGLMVLVGVVVNNGIVLIDLVNRLRLEGVPRDEAVRTACRQRLRPILLTTLTTVFGLIPMAVGDAQFVGTPYYPMGRLVLGGLVVSMLYTLLLVPLLYTIVDDFGLALKTWSSTVFAGRAKGGGDSAPAPASTE